MTARSLPRRRHTAKADRVLKRFRALCLSYPESSEKGSWGHPNFRAGARTFAAFEWIEGRPSLAFRLPGGMVDSLLLDRQRFFPTPYGKGQWVSLWADRPLDWRLVRQLADSAYRTVALKRMIAALDAGPSRRRTAAARREHDGRG